MAYGVTLTLADTIDLVGLQFYKTGCYKISCLKSQKKLSFQVCIFKKSPYI